MNELEARALLERTGNYYDEEDIDYVITIWRVLAKHKGFEDNRRDKRFVVKFHDIFYYAPDEIPEYLFYDFCEMCYDNITDNAFENNIIIDDMLTRYDVGHYRAFKVDIPEITDDNILELAEEIWNELALDGIDYVEDYIKIVKDLQDLEDNYMQYWLGFIDNDDTHELFKKTLEKYNKEK